ncbi:MAG: 1-aminocyclopropane-1-carboxylate deaminase/D-cysteine desulfhydrase [Bacteroidia bacterium]|nr:1-aminocyclopropane-1-carboxylate deaminase/D-cysteine desulfhydrase [Bacteroidia bacterium]
MLNSNFIPPLQQITDSFLEKKGVKLFVLRTDLNHSEISGNKLYKLKYNIEEAKNQNKNTLLTFGGAFSNHIAATAAAGKIAGMNTIGIIRGDELPQLNPTLRLAKENGMQLYFVSREVYRNKDELNNYVHKTFNNNCYIIPEGGSNKLGVKGCTKIVEEIKIPFDYICCPCGTGATLSGIVLSLKEQQQAIGFQVLKAEHYIHNEVKHWLAQFDAHKSNWQVNEDYHFGGYAKCNDKLKQFTVDFKKQYNIPLDYVYTAKMIYGIFELIKKDFFRPETTIIAIHTGGLQGNNGFQD